MLRNYETHDNMIYKEKLASTPPCDNCEKIPKYECKENCEKYTKWAEECIYKLREIEKLDVQTNIDINLSQLKRLKELIEKIEETGKIKNVHPSKRATLSPEEQLILEVKKITMNI